MIIVNFVETVYPMSVADEDDYCPDGDSSVYETGLSFKALVGYMTQYNQPSCWPASGATYEWLMAETEQDYRTGDYTHRSMHYHHENHPRYAKYWRIAMRAAGVIK